MSSDKQMLLLSAYLMLEHDPVDEQSSNVLLSAMKLKIQKQDITHFESLVTV